jgi:L-aminopeptidase/D-esterase-like protein
MAVRWSRRRFGTGVAGALAGWGLARRAAPAAPAPPDAAGRITDVPGILVGHFTDTRRPTGCTVVIAEAGAVGGVDVRGGAPATRETDLLDPANSVGVVHAVLLTGGSAFGLDAATGVMRVLEERQIGLVVGPARVPIVPAAALFDLRVGDARIRPDAAAGEAAARAARSGPVAEGNVGAGAGATVGKLFGVARAMKSGLGTASLRRPDGLVVGAVVAVNAVGDVLDPETGIAIAGMRGPNGKVFGSLRALGEGRALDTPVGGNTVIGVVATDVRLDKGQASRVARMAHGGLARVIQPAHTPRDGDTLFVLSTGARVIPEPEMVVGALAAEAVTRAILRGVRLAKGLPGLPSSEDLK